MVKNIINRLLKLFKRNKAEIINTEVENVDVVEVKEVIKKSEPNKVYSEYDNPYFKRMKRVFAIYKRTKKHRVKKKLKKRIIEESNDFYIHNRKMRLRNGKSY